MVATGRLAGRLFADLERLIPGLRFRAADEQVQLRPELRLFVIGQGVRDMHHALQPTDAVAAVPALSGG